MINIIDLGMHPFADTFIRKEDLSKSEPVYPLSCDLCENCGQIQASCMTSPDERYSLYDYSYTSSNSSFSRNHWVQYAIEVSEKLDLAKDSSIVEVGSNDGFLAEQFLKLDNKVLGVDPSGYMAKLAKERGVETLTKLFDSTIVEEIKEKIGEADLIVANNVFNHSDDPLDFAKAASKILAKNGTFVYELPYWIDTLKSKKFDQIYHEHVSYFTLKSSLEILKRAGMRIYDVELVDYHGGSIRVYAKKQEDFEGANEKVNEIIRKEIEFGSFKEDTYKDFMRYLKEKRSLFLKKIHDIKLQGKSIIGVGAAAKANTFLAFYGLDNTILDYVTDSSPHKQGKHTPLTRIPIVSDEIFSEYDEPYALILSWNISDKLKDILSKINPKIKFLSLE